MATNAIYKRYDGSNWVEYHFATNAGQVTTTAGRKFVTSSVKVNGVAFTPGTGDVATVTIDGTHITGKASAVSGSSLQYIANGDTIAVALGKLDKACKDAYDAIPSGVLTTSNYANTLGSVYQAKGDYQPLDSDLTAIAGLSGAGLLRRNSSGTTWTLDGTTYVPTGRTINGKALSSDVVLYATDINLTNSEYSRSINSEIAEIRRVAEGKNTTFVLNYNDNDNGDALANAEFNSQADSITLPYERVSNDPDRKKATVKLRACSNPYIMDNITVSRNWNELSLKLGDIIYVDNTEVPDRWISSIDTDVKMITFSKLETSKPDMAFSAITGKPTTLAGYGITDAKIANGVITLGSNTITPLTQHQDISGKAPNNHASTATTYGVGTSTKYGHVKLATGDMKNASHEDGVACSKNHTHSQYLTSHQSLAGYATETWVDSNFTRTFAQSSAPDSPSTGDLWFQTA